MADHVYLCCVLHAGIIALAVKFARDAAAEDNEQIEFAHDTYDCKAAGEKCYAALDDFKEPHAEN